MMQLVCKIYKVASRVVVRHTPSVPDGECRTSTKNNIRKLTLLTN